MGKETTYGVWAVRSGASIFGHAEAWCKENGKPLEFDTRETAEAYIPISAASSLIADSTANMPWVAPYPLYAPADMRLV